MEGAGARWEHGLLRERGGGGEGGKGGGVLWDAIAVVVVIGMGDVNVEFTVGCQDFRFLSFAALQS